MTGCTGIRRRTMARRARCQWQNAGCTMALRVSGMHSAQTAAGRRKFLFDNDQSGTEIPGDIGFAPSEAKRRPNRYEHGAVCAETIISPCRIWKISHPPDHPLLLHRLPTQGFRTRPSCRSYKNPRSFRRGYFLLPYPGFPSRL